ncbi:MAG: hypothetical protein Q8P05_01600 [Candidatus Diapherotrites archaeon]|nr:hypothetical protein [Candidatus Diapherotrites archaeon]MDZ4256235.1 hypothetical protein [archaeon]
MADDETMESETPTPEEAPSTVLSEEEGTMEESKLPFPRATVTNMMRQYMDSGKQIKGQVKDEMNIWLGKMVERISKKMNAHPYTYVDFGMLREAIDPYERIQDVELEKEHIIKQLEAVKSQCDVLIREVDRKFTL